MNTEVKENTQTLDLMISFELIEKDLLGKREQFTSYLNMEPAELKNNQEYIRFLEFTTGDLLERATKLNRLTKNLVSTNLRQKQKMQELLEQITRVKMRVEAGV